MTNSSDMAIDKWNEERESIREKFQLRENVEAGNLMQIHIDSFKRALLWLEETNSSYLKLPPNIEERLSFIEGRPNHYHSYIQLDALFSEVEKLLSIQKLKQKSEGR
ncbi:hypothetical protein RZN22_13690 [Bacillaceae bacterium S4-13-58]